MTKYRAVANGNIVDDVHPSLVEAGIYEPIEGDETESGPAPTAPASASAPAVTESAAEPVAPMTTDDLPVARHGRRRPR